MPFLGTKPLAESFVELLAVLALDGTHDSKYGLGTGGFSGGRVTNNADPQHGGLLPAGPRGNDASVAD